MATSAVYGDRVKISDTQSLQQSTPPGFGQYWSYGKDGSGNTIFKYINPDSPKMTQAYNAQNQIVDVPDIGWDGQPWTNKKWLNQINGFSISPDGRSMVSTVPPGQTNVSGVDSSQRYTLNGSGLNTSVNFSYSNKWGSGGSSATLLNIADVAPDKQGEYLSGLTKYATGEYLPVKQYVTKTGNAFGDLLASIDPSTAISRELTKVAQPVEKAVSTGLADVDKNLSLSKNAPVIAAVALAVVVPVIGAEVGASLMEAGYLTSAANASNAVLAAGGTAAQAAAAAASATATATAVGTAIASATAQVAQGVPVEDAIRNATVAATVQLNAPGAAKTVNDIVGNPAVTNLVVSTAASVVQTAATGGNEADIIRNAKGALVGSGVTSATDSNIAGRAVGGGVTGGVAGALVGAAGAIGSDFKKTGADTTTSVSGVDPGVQVAGGDDSSALNLARISAMPEMLGKAGETSSQISVSTDSDGITAYSRTITGTTPDGKPYEYIVKYDPGAPTGKQIAYITNYKFDAGGELLPGMGVSATFKRPDFTATDTSKTGGAVAGEGLVILGDKGTGGGSSVSTADQKVLDLIKPTPTPGQATVGVPATFTPATAPGRGVETDEERIARIDAQTARVIAGEADYTERSRPRTTEQAVIDLTGIGGANVGGNVVVGPGADAGAGNATGNVVVADAGGGNAAGNVVISDGGLGGGGNAAGDVIVGPGDGGGGPGGNVTIDAGGGGGNATSNVSGNVVVDEPPGEEDKPPEDEDKPPEEEDKPPGEKEEPYKPDLFIYSGKTPKPRPRTNLGTTLQAPFAPSTTLGQALTGYRGAGEIEGKKTGKPRRDVWNEESLRLKDALGL